MSNYPVGNMFPDDPRSPLYTESPSCNQCDGELTLDIDYDEEGQCIHSMLCQNSDCVLNKE